jgi:hypothetical protein
MRHPLLDHVGHVAQRRRQDVAHLHGDEVAHDGVAGELTRERRL